MKLNLKHLNLRSTHALDSWVERQILALDSARQIDEAHVELGRHPAHSPAYEVRVHLVTPGPDLRVEARDHTIRAAFTKGMAQLLRGLATRAARPTKNLRARRGAGHRGGLVPHLA